ncbi:MAG: 5'/3'-nucleotidase SurE [candidate division WOR-3 bacterium]
MPIILISNDDGIEAEGLKVLEEVASEFGEVWTVAPLEEQSGSSHRLTFGKEVRVYKFGPRKFAVDGSPADSVLIGLFGILPAQPKIILSGINAGYNLSEDVFYSGTVAAAREGAMYGFRAIAFSLERSDNMMWETAKEVAKMVLKKFLDYEDFRLLSVNIPSLPLEEIKGFKWTFLGSRVYKEPVRVEGENAFRIEGKPVFKMPPGSDIYAVKNGYVSITPLSLDITDRDALLKLKNLEISLFLQKNFQP